MILVFNTFITGKSSTGGQWERLGVGYDRGNLSTPNKIDILKYSLASYAKAFPWSKVIINAELDEEYNTPGAKADLEAFVRQEFKDFNYYYSPKRCLTQDDWKRVWRLLDDDLIFYQCNHDHIFIDHSQDYLIELTQLYEEYGDNLVISTSHWPEAIRTAKCGYIDHEETHPKSMRKEYVAKQNHIVHEGPAYDSLQIITKEMFWDWYMEDDWSTINIPPGLFKSGKMELTRSEGVGVIGVAGIKELFGKKCMPQKYVVPYKELFRHFDGYWHQRITNAQCPAIDIPPGFFEGEIKIRYGYDDRKEGWVNINPKSVVNYAHREDGTDYRFTLEMIPLFWKDRIVEYDINPNMNEQKMIGGMMLSVMEMMYTNGKYNHYIDKDVECKILNKYLETHPHYKI
jgi:hypothetical protein